jgi:hypothetical protein
MGNSVFKPQVLLGYSGFGITLPAPYGSVGSYIVSGGLGAEWEFAPKGNAETVVSGAFQFASVEEFGLLGATIKPIIIGLNGEIKRIHTLSDKFSAGFGAGLDFGVFSAKTTIPVVGSYRSSTSTIVPYGIAAFTYKFNTPFSVHAGIRVGYTIETASLSGGGGGSTNVAWNGFTVEPAVGGSFEPAPNIGIDFSYTVPVGTYSTTLTSITIAARIKK